MDNMVYNASYKAYCSTSYSGRTLMSSAETNSLFATFITIAPITIIANAIVIYRIIKSRQQHRVSNFLILVLSISDFLMGVITLPCVSILYSAYASTRVCIFEMLTQFISTSLVYTSITMIMLVAIDRLIHQKFPTRYNTIFSIKIARIATAASVLFSIVCSGLLTMSSVFNQIRTVSFICSMFAIIIIGIVFGSYIRAYIHVLKFVRSSTIWNRQSVAGDAEDIPPPTTQRRRQTPKYLRKFATTVFFIILAICFCYLPFLVVTMVALFTSYVQDCVMDCSGEMGTLRLTLHASYALIYSNSSLNAFIILFRNRSILRDLTRRRKAAVVPSNNGETRRISIFSIMQ